MWRLVVPATLAGAGTIATAAAICHEPRTALLPFLAR
jgi:hypothetical protein